VGVDKRIHSVLSEVAFLFTNLAKEGLESWLLSAPPRYVVPQRAPPDAETREQVRAKLDTPLKKGYIGKGTVLSLTGYFSEPIGETNLQMVYDTTKSSLNATLWVPSFCLPSLE
jgi:hypothetical protein